MSLFVEQYKPNTLSQIVGNKKILPDILKWIQSPTTKMCLIHGSNGIGKTLCVNLICEELNIQTYYVDNLYENIDINILKSLNRINPINNKKNYIIIEEIDTIANFVLDEIVKNINNINVPIICISNTNYIPSLKIISDKITNFKLFAPYDNEITSFLQPILAKNKIIMTQSELIDIIHNCNNDVRYILNTIEMISYKKSSNKQNNFKDHTSINMFDIGKGLFDMDKTLDEKYALFSLEYSLMPLFVQENYINNTFNTKDPAKKLENIYNSSNSIANGDLFDKMLHENNDWDLGKYITTCNIEATNNCNTKIINFPEYFKKNKKQFSSYENSLKNINYYYPINSQIDKLSVEKKKIKNKKETKETKNKKEKEKEIKETNKKEKEIKETITINEEPILLKSLPKINKKIKVQEEKEEEKEICFKKPSKITRISTNQMNDRKEEINEEIKEPKQKNKLILKKVQIIDDSENKDTILCECGAIIKKTSKTAHLKSKKHLESLSEKSS